MFHVGKAQNKNFDSKKVFWPVNNLLKVVTALCIRLILL